MIMWNCASRWSSQVHIIHIIWQFSLSFKFQITYKSLSIIDCCQLLAIDAKTLRQWLTQAQMSLHVHPTDARLRCLTDEQVRILARLHNRVLASPVSSTGVSPTPEEVTRQSLPPAADAELAERLRHLEAQVARLQAQLTDLALQLLQERQWRLPSHLLGQDTQLALATNQTLASGACSALSVLDRPAMAPLVCHPTERRSRLIPLIEYGAKGQYVLICPQEGELPIAPDSPEWFAWLTSLTSFRFVGQAGYFSARRGNNRRPNRSWYAQRAIHQKNYNKDIGVSEHVTTERLEYIAEQFQ
ncbi:MAG TPA: hypothetical protein VGF67_11185 [Ktedonobacteraceae bacterium]